MHLTFEHNIISIQVNLKKKKCNILQISVVNASLGGINVFKNDVPKKGVFNDLEINYKPVLKNRIHKNN